MLDPWIIEKIRRREESQREREAVQVEIPLDNPARRDHTNAPEQNPERGVTIIDL
jgi:hypothetical protein